MGQSGMRRLQPISRLGIVSRPRSQLLRAGIYSFACFAG